MWLQGSTRHCTSCVALLTYVVYTINSTGTWPGTAILNKKGCLEVGRSGIESCSLGCFASVPVGLAHEASLVHTRGCVCNAFLIDIDKFCGGRSFKRLVSCHVGGRDL